MNITDAVYSIEETIVEIQSKGVVIPTENLKNIYVKACWIIAFLQQHAADAPGNYLKDLIKALPILRDYLKDPSKYYIENLKVRGKKVRLKTPIRFGDSGTVDFKDKPFLCTYERKGHIKVKHLGKDEPDIEIETTIDNTEIIQ